MSEKFAFLSPEWEQAADDLGKNEQFSAPKDIAFSLNVTVTPTPYGDKVLSIVAHDAVMTIEKIHVEAADITVKTDYETAKKLFLSADMNIILSAMLEGKIVVQGDIARLLAMAPHPGVMPSIPFSEELSAALQAITLE